MRSLAANADLKGFDCVMVGTRKAVSYSEHLIMLPSRAKWQVGNSKTYGTAKPDTSVSRLIVCDHGTNQFRQATLDDLRMFANRQ